jgi:hypothetical protein
MERRRRFQPEARARPARKPVPGTGWDVGDTSSGPKAISVVTSTITVRRTALPKNEAASAINGIDIEGGYNE